MLTRSSTELDRAEQYHSFPMFLPDGRHFVYQRFSSSSSSGIYVGLSRRKARGAEHQAACCPYFLGRLVSASSGLRPGNCSSCATASSWRNPLTTAGWNWWVEKPVSVAEQLGAFLTFASFSVSENECCIPERRWP